MEADETTSGQGDQGKRASELHWDSQNWKSHLQLMEDELAFIARLLNSYMFEPNTPNLFERLQNYQERLKNIRSEKKVVRQLISKHENDLGGMLECTENSNDMEYYRKHRLLQTKVLSCLNDFQNLKSEIFNYAGGILKKRKPKTH
ncbi:MAG: hypothetical protein WBG90_05825 [Saonia sp.]